MNNKVHVLGLLGVLFISLAACVKNEPTIRDPKTVQVNVINATDTVINFYLNGTRQNSLTGIYPLAANGYTALPIGTQLLAFRKLFDNQNFNDADTLFTLPVKLDSVASNTRYSVFAAGGRRNTAFTILDTLTSSTTTARLRFVVASPTVTGLRVFLNDTLRFTGSAFKSVSTFNEVSAGQKQVKIYAASNSTTPLYTGTIILSKGVIYTLFSQGTTANFKAGLLVNQ